MRRRLNPLPVLRYDFYDAVVRALTIGPRREVTLRLELRLPPDRQCAAPRHRGRGDLVDVRFGGIDDFERVAAFFRGQADSGGLRAGLHYLRHAAESRPGRLVFELQWDSTEAEVRFRCSGLSVSDPLPPSAEPDTAPGE